LPGKSTIDEQRTTIMFFFIKEWPNRSATLMAENGTVLWTFASVEEARRVCNEWYRVQGEQVDYKLYTLQDPEPAEEENDSLQDLSCACCAVG